MTRWIMKIILLFLLLIPSLAFADNGIFRDENLNIAIKDGEYLCYVRPLPKGYIDDMGSVLKNKVIAFAKISIISKDNGKNVEIDFGRKNLNINLPFLTADSYSLGYGERIEENSTGNIYGLTATQPTGAIIFIREKKGMNVIISDCDDSE
ncbi:exported hypothetical protein [Xenorhabdus bovienii str. puntauvense]|uniref:Uncharacterized protein n=2 Tax=Xenorhabdus bovienii TaxID=40576 RepID=A0A077NGL5_XENBV|nr:exported hypothetical protein [Xenorhabdus bovienii str. puntauvense]